MRNPHRAGMYVNPEHTEDPPARSERAKPEIYAEEGVNFPYRGVEQHGVEYHSTIPDELEGAQYSEEMPLPPHYMPEPKKPTPVPVKIVSESSCERHPFMADQFLIDGSESLMIVGRSDARDHVVIRNLSTSVTVYIGPSSNVKADTGYPIPPGTDTPRMHTTEAIYCIADPAGTAQIGVMWEYTVSV